MGKRTIKELRLFKITNTSLVYPVFYIEAVDILEATMMAKEIIDSLSNERVISIVSTLDIPLLRLDEE